MVAVPQIVTRASPSFLGFVWSDIWSQQREINKYNTATNSIATAKANRKDIVLVVIISFNCLLDTADNLLGWESWWGRLSWPMAVSSGDCLDPVNCWWRWGDLSTVGNTVLQLGMLDCVRVGKWNEYKHESLLCSWQWMPTAASCSCCC